MFLARCQLRKSSSPFDWLIPISSDTNSLKERFELLDNFEQFFNFDDFEFLRNKLSSTGHYFANNVKFNLSITHHFNSHFSDDFNYNVVKEKYLKRYYRLIDNIKKVKEYASFILQKLGDKWSGVTMLILN